MAPTVSCLIHTYQYGHFLQAAIEGVLGQEYDGPLQIIVGDDGSTDNTASVVSGYPAVAYYRQENAGVADLVNHTLPLAEGDYIAFGSGDDIWLPGKTALQVAMLERPEIGLVYGDMTVVDEELNVLHESYWDNTPVIQPRRGYVAAEIARTQFVSGGTMMFRRELLEDIPPIPPQEPFEDWWISRHIARDAELDYTREPLILYRYHGQNRSLFI